MLPAIRRGRLVDIQIGLTIPLRKQQLDWGLRLRCRRSHSQESGARERAVGCFHPPTQTVTDITDERMLLSVSTTQSTLDDQIQYSGIAHVVRVGASHPRNGDRGPERRRALRLGRRSDRDADHAPAVELRAVCLQRRKQRRRRVCSWCGWGAGAGAPAVTVTHMENVGPYATVQLHSTDASALNAWLAQNGYGFRRT